MAKKDQKDICDNPPEIIVPQHPDCNPEFSECAHDNRISIDLVPGKCATRGADAHFKKGYELYHEGKADEALAELAESLKTDPINAEAHLLIGDIHERRQQYAEAVKQYEAAVKLSPDDKMIRFKLQNALAQRVQKKS